MFTYNIKLKEEYKNKQVKDLTVEELTSIIGDLFQCYIMNFNNMQKDVHRGYFIGDKPPFDQNTPICQ